ncbi:MAG: hypothetical protein HYX22_00160 [Candidatus Yanofskybacteria bacterium]|nr:hypothetical protein [Candidatus Yanofskybacteria bacterium]
MTKLILLTIVAIVLVGVVVFLYSGDTVQAPGSSPTPTTTDNVPVPTPTPTPVNEESSSPLPTVSESKVTVTYSDFGYGPAIVTVEKGDTVIFDNKGSKMMWTASAVHPTHKTYPGSDIAFCGTPQSISAFDACKGYGSGESWEFKFDHQGTWKYHNHMQANHTGTIVVE